MLFFNSKMYTFNKHLFADLYKEDNLLNRLLFNFLLILF